MVVGPERRVEERCGVSDTENGMLRLRHDLGLSWQKARPTPPRPTARPRPASKKFPALIAAIARDHPEAERLEVGFLDEARVGQTSRVGRRWFERARAACATCATRRSPCSGRSVPNYDDLLDAGCAAWSALLAEAGRIHSLCALDWAAPVSS